MRVRFQSPKPRPSDDRSEQSGFSMIEVVLAIGLLAFGVAIALRLLTGSLESLQSARASLSALDLVTIIEAKLNNPGIDDPPEQKNEDQISLKRRFFNEVFDAIQDNGAIQLIAYPYEPADPPTDDNSLGVRLMPIPEYSGGTLDRFFSSNLSKVLSDAPETMYRLILSASPANEEKLIYTQSESTVKPFAPEKIADFVDYDCISGQLRKGSNSQVLQIAQIKSDVDSDFTYNLAIRVHIFRESFNFKPGAVMDAQQLNRDFHVKDLAFTFDTMLLAY
jgi:hypothetical protein